MIRRWSLVVAVLLEVASALAQEKPHRTEISHVPWPGFGVQPKVVYGTDDRIDVYQETDPVRLSQAASTCALVESLDLTNNGNGTYTLALSQYREFGSVACAGEPFGTQPVGAFCSGFMVGDDIIATAGHCLSGSSLSGTRFVFGFVMEDATTVVDTFPAENVYTPVEILGHALAGDFDYTVARVDRPITAPGAHALAIRRQGNIGVGEHVGVIGHPAGLPMKLAFGANTAVRSTGTDGYFVANTDTYGGNSGSPIFNATTGIVEGILVRGETDYVFNNGSSCFSSNVVSNTGGRGEDVSKSTSFVQFVPEIAGSAGTLTSNIDRVGCGDTVTLTVRDADLSGNATVAVSATTSSGDSEIFALSAVVGQSGVFSGTVQFVNAGAVSNNHVVELSDGSAAAFTYHDSDNGAGAASNVHKNVTLDCQPPGIFNVLLGEIGSSQAEITFDTTEAATTVVRYGLACGALTGEESGVENVSHSVVLTGLTPLTPYFFTIRATDEAGNTTELGAGECLQFTTSAPLDYFTELFGSGATALSGHRLVFTPENIPSGYTACTEAAASYDTDPTGGIELVLSDDGQGSVVLAGGKTFPFFGESFDEVFVSANGYVTFDASDESYDETLVTHFALKRLSAFFHDMSPNVRGTVSYRQTADRLAITFDDVPAYTVGAPSASNTHSFQIELFFDGRIQLTYKTLYSAQALVGLSKGLGVPTDFLASNLPGYANCGSADADSDGLPDAWESLAGLNPNSAAGDQGATGDPDHDGLSNAQEYQHGTNPQRADSDFDGVDDATEVDAATDPTGEGQYHSADISKNGKISLSELVRVIQFYNSEGLHCQEGTEDGYAPDGGPTTCARHNSDYRDPAFDISLSELLRLIQFYNSAGYTRDVFSEDSFGVL